MAYAAETDVAVDRTKLQIEQMLRQRGAREYATGWNADGDRIQFQIHGSIIRFILPRVDPEAPEIAALPNGRPRASDARARLIAQKDRSRWRALYLVVKAKLEAVDAGIAIFEQEFLAFIVAPNGLTVGDMLVPRITEGQWPTKLLGE